MFRKISAIIIPTIIAVGIIIYMLYQTWDTLIQALHHLVPAWLAVAVAICVSAWVLRGSRYGTIVSSLGYPIRLAVSTACIFVSQTANLIIPARLGDFVRVFILKHEYSMTYSEGVSSIVVERVFDIFTVAILGAMALPFILNVPSWFYIVVILPIVAGLVFFVFIFCTGKCTTENKYIRIVLTMLHEIRKASLSFRSLFVLGTSSIIIWLLDVLVCLSVVMMLGQSIPFLVVVLAIVIGNLVKAVPVTPGGVGTYELALTGVFTLSGIPWEMAFLIAVIDHMIKNLVTLAGGIISIYYLGDWVVPTMKSTFATKMTGGPESER
jgi:glycosyltransferase AglD